MRGRRLIIGLLALGAVAAASVLARPDADAAVSVPAHFGVADGCDPSRGIDEPCAAAAAPVTGTGLFRGNAGPVFSLPTTGFYVAADCNPGAAGVQGVCSYGGSQTTADIDVVFGNVDQVGVDIGALEFELIADGLQFNPRNGVNTNKESNPDFNDAGFSTGNWLCTPPNPNRDKDPSAAVANSFISCFNTDSMAGQAVPAGTFVKLATVHYDVTGSTGGTFALQNVIISNNGGAELMSCNPIVTAEGPCFSASLAPPMPPPDADNDGWPEPGPDNCPSVANTSQQNSDANFTFLGSYGKSYNDLTWPNSDRDGNACDADDDNDGLADTTEAGGPPCASASAATDPLVRDSDGDRVLDNAECVLGFDPASAASKPPAIVAPDADSDGLPDPLDPDDANVDTDFDKVRDGVEFRAFNSNPSSDTTDGDICPDGREVASVNGDTAVNATDLGQVAQSFGSGAAYIVYFDMNRDGTINAVDLGFVAGRFGVCPKPVGQTDVTVSIADSPDPIDYFQNTTLTITVSNVSGLVTATGVMLALPKQGEPIMASSMPADCALWDSGSYGATEVIRCAVPDLGPTGTAVIQITMNASPILPHGYQMINCPIVFASDEPETLSHDNTACTSTTINPFPTPTYTNTPVNSPTPTSTPT